MALVVEDGTGKADANSYATAAEADAYFLARGITIWAPLQSGEKDEALIRATDYMAKYTWKGNRVTATQAIDWPRQNVLAYGFTVDSASLPTAIKNACIELAVRAASGPLAGDIKVDDTGRVPSKLVTKVGPIDKETTYGTRGAIAVPTQHSFPAVDYILKEFLNTGSYVYR